MFVQQVRGHCSAHDKITGNAIYEPNDLQCDDLKSQKNRAKLGGIDHSSPAVVGPSRYIPDELRGNVTIPWSRRPVVAYAGGRDGMLHAFFVTGDKAWTAEGASMPGVVEGRELWALLPPGQLCGLATNGAMVDATINVIDAFGNFPRDQNGDGVFDHGDASERPSGIRTWRTILVASVGEGGSELFALDVTNPLRPALLWHVSGPDNMDDQFFDVATNTWTPMDTTRPATYAYKWHNWDDGDAATTHIPTPYNTTSQAILDQVKTGRYAYRNLGLAFGSAVGMLWQGNAFRYVTWVTTSSANWADPVTPLGYKGIETYAIDLVTGEKLWQWQNRYTRQNGAGNVIADNAIPGRPALLDVNGDGAVDRVYVGDLEGHMWELTAADGKNYNYLQDSGTKKYVSLPYFGTPAMTGAGADATIVADFKPAASASLAQQPLTSPIGIGRMLSVPADVEPYLKDRIAVAQGTMGVDWSIAPFERGHVFILPAYPEKMVVAYKDPVTLATVQKTVDTRERNIDLAAKPQLRLQGVLLPEADWDIELNVGERVFGMPKIVGNDVIINTSYGGFGGDIADTYLDAGSTLRISAAAGTETLESIGKAFGGALVMDKSVVVTSASGMARSTPAREIKGGTQTNPRNRYTPTDFTTWEQLSPRSIQPTQ
jgi:type IV pilus assembly protein PilY1